MTTGKGWFFVSMSTKVKEKNFFNPIMQLINPNYPWKSKVKQIKTIQEKMLQRYTLYSITQTRTTRTTTFLDFFYHLSYTWVDFICFTCLPILSLLEEHFGQSELRTSLKELYRIHSITFVLLKGTIIFKRHLSGAASVGEVSVINNFRELWWSITRKCSWWSNF